MPDIYSYNTTGIDANTYSALDMAAIGPIVLGAVLVIGIILLLSGNYAKYKRLRGFLQFLGISCIYFGKGLIGLAVFGSFFGGLWYIGQLGSSGTIRFDVIAGWIGIAIAGFFSIAGFGWLLDKFWGRVKKNEKKYKKQQKEGYKHGND